MARMWGGRYAGELDARMWRLNDSIDVDVRLAAADVLDVIVASFAQNIRKNDRALR